MTTSPDPTDAAPIGPSEERLRIVLREELDAALQQLRDRAAAAPTRGASTLPLLLTSKETAELLRVDQRTLRRLVQEGEVPHPLRIGRRAVRWDSRALYAALGLK